MCSHLWSHVQNTSAFSCALLWRVVYSSQLLLFDVALIWRAFHIDLKSGREGFRGTRI